jgi:hypothetical protein
MQLTFDQTFEASSLTGFRFRVKRISLAQRLRFLAGNHDLMQRLKFFAAAIEKSDPQRVEIANLELELSRILLQECLISLGDGDQQQPVDAERIDWVLTRAPAALCVEVLARISEEISLSETRRKN